MKKVLLGFISIIFATQVSFAQPVSDMAVIPMGITIQNIMRLTITKGGNIEFVFKSANDITTGLGPNAAYNTTGNVVATQAWNLQLVADAGDFVNESGVLLGGLDIVGFTPTCAAATVVAGINNLTNTASTTAITSGAVTSGTPFTLAWECGTPAPGGTTSQLDGTEAAGRYTVNVILSLVAGP